jgi:hypothetical protein
MTKEDKGKPSGAQPLLDALKAAKTRDRSPIWQKQQAALAKLREKKELLAHPPALAEALREVQAEAARLDAEVAKEEAARSAPEPAQTAELANSPPPAGKPATESVAEPAHEAANEGATETTDDQQSSIGAPRIDWPHLEEALQACGDKFPKATRSDAKQVKFVADFLRGKGDDVGYELTEAGEKIETQRRTIHRRINEWYARRAQLGS